MWVVSANRPTQFASVTEKTISGFHVFPGSAETLVRRGKIVSDIVVFVLKRDAKLQLTRRGKITNHHSIACSHGNISAKITKIG